MLNKMKARLLIGLGGLAVTSFLVMMGYTIGSQSVTNHTQKQIQTEAHKLLIKEKEKEKPRVKQRHRDTKNIGKRRKPSAAAQDTKTEE